MGLEIKSLVVIISYAIISNLILLSIANLNVGLSCPDLIINPTISGLNYTSDVGTATEFRANVIDIATNRCSGIPAWLYWAFEVPVLIGLLYVVRGFIGAT